MYITYLSSEQKENSSSYLYVFIHGFKLNSGTWQDIPKQLLESNPTSSIALVDIEEKDYLLSVPELSSLIIQELNKKEIEEKREVIFIGHSLGCFPILSIISSSSFPCKKVFLIDSPVKNELYYEYLVKQTLLPGNNEIDHARLQNYDLLPEIEQISSSVSIWIHMRMEPDASAEQIEILLGRMKWLSQLTTLNEKSRLFVNCNVSHFIHQDIPKIILSNIQLLTNY